MKEIKEFLDLLHKKFPIFSPGERGSHSVTLNEEGKLVISLRRSSFYDPGTFVMEESDLERSHEDIVGEILKYYRTQTSKLVKEKV